MTPKYNKDKLMESVIPLASKIKPRVLVICRGESSADLYNNHFVELSSEPVNAWSSEGALDLFQTSFFRGRPFDLVCLDYHLPGMDGITLARHLRAIDPDCLLHLFSTRNQFEADFLEEFDDFGGFFFRPSDSFKNLSRLIHLIRMKKGIEKLSGTTSPLYQAEGGLPMMLSGFRIGFYHNKPNSVLLNKFPTYLIHTKKL